MNTFILVALLCLASCLHLGESLRRGRGGDPNAGPNVFLLCSVPFSFAEGKKYEGEITMTCYERQCKGEMNADGQIKEVDMAPFSTKTEKVPLDSPARKKLRVTRIEVHQNLSMVVSITDNLKLYDIFSLYPLKKADTFFVMAVPLQTKYAVVVPVEESARLKVSVRQRGFSLDEPGMFEQFYKKVTKDGLIWKDDFQIKGSIIRSDNPVGIFFGTAALQGQSPSVRRLGRDYIMYRPPETTIATAIAFAPVCALVAWSDQDEKWGRNRQRLRCAQFCKSPETIMFNHTWVVARVTATSDIVLWMQYATDEIHNDPMISSAFLPPIEEYKMEYIVRRPFPKGKGPEPVLMFSGRMMELRKIFIFDDYVEKYLARCTHYYDVPGNAFERTIMIWVGCPFVNDEMHFYLDPDGYNLDRIRFGIMLYAASNDTNYITDIGGYLFISDYRRDVRFFEQIGDIDDCSDYYDPDKSRLVQGKEGGSQMGMTTIIVLSVIVPCAAVIVVATGYAIRKSSSNKESGRNEAKDPVPEVEPNAAQAQQEPVNDE